MNRRKIVRSTARFILTLVAGLAFITAMSLCSYAQTHNLITEKIVESNTVPLQGSVHPLATAKNDQGAAGDDQPLGHVFLMLNRSAEQQRTLDAVVDQLHDTKSPLYHKWLTPEEYGRHFGISDSDLQAVESWLQSKGFTIEETPASRNEIIFTGTVGQLRRAFNVDIHNYNWNGQTYQANVGIPTIPAALAPAVIGFKQLHNFPHKPNVVPAGVVKRDGKTGQWSKVSGPPSAPEITFNYSGYMNWDVTPQDFYTIYNENTALTSGITGAGTTIAVIEETGLKNQSDIANFRSAFGLPAYPGTPNSTQGGYNYMNGNTGGSPACTAASTPTSTDEEGEALLDIEWAGAVAPNAIIDFVACKTGSGVGSYGTDIAATYIANHLYSTVAATSLSYGICETSAGTTGKTFYTNLWELMAAEGITAVVSSGDAGSAGCNQNASYESSNIASNSMSSTAYNISAGGTDFSDVYQVSGGTPSTYWSNTNSSTFASALSYIPEITWGAYCSNPLFPSLEQANAVTTFGTTYTTQAFCNNTTAGSDGFRAVAGGGGGISVYNAIPTWQSVYGIGKANTSTTFRNQPDISFFASSGWWSHAIVYCQSDAGYACTYTNTQDAYYLSAGGTSFVAPQINGLMALINQRYGRQGQANYTFYNLASQQYGTTSTVSGTIANCSGSALGPNVSPSCIFHDIANDTPCLSGGTTMCGTANGALSASTIASDIVQACRSTVTTCYHPSGTYGLSSVSNTVNTLAYQSAQGYDLGTGLGSVNITNLLNGWNTTSATFTSSTTLSANPTTIAQGGSTVLTGTVTASQRGGVPSGVVNFYIGSRTGTSLGSAALVANACTGTAPNVVCTASAPLTVQGTALACGSNSLIAYFPGDAANDGPSTSTAVAVTGNDNCGQSAQTISWATPPPASAVYGSNFTVSATATSGLAVTFTSTGSCSNVGSTYTMTSGTGTCSVIANQAGNSSWLPAPTLTGSTSATPAAQTITFTTNAPASAAYNTSFTVAATGGASGNPVVFTSAGACTNTGAVYTMTSGTGNCSVIADQAGNANYAAATEVTETTAAASANGSVSVASSLNPSVYGQSVTFTATITSDTGLLRGRNGARRNGGKPMDVTGGVTWSDNTGCGTTTVTPNAGTGVGTATCTTSNLSVGSDTVTANYSGDSNHNAGNGSVMQTVEASTVSSATTVASTANPSTYGQGVSFTASVSEQLSSLKKRNPAGKAKLDQPVPTGTVQFSIDGNAFGSPVTLVSGSAASGSTSTLTAGTHTVTAAYSGDANYLASTGTLSGGQSVNQASQTITCGGLPASEPYNGTFTMSCSASSNLAVTYASSGSCSNAGAAYTMTSGAGSCLVTVSQAGDSNYSAAAPFNGSVTATPASQSITVSVAAPPTAVNKTSFTVAASASSGLPVTYAASGACTVSGSTYTMNSTKVGAVCTETMTQAGNGNYAAATPVVETTKVATAIAPTVSVTVPASAPYQSTYTVVATTNASTTPTLTAAPATVCTISGTTVTMLSGMGTCTVTAKWAADDVYKAATATGKTTATKLTSVITWASPDPITYGTTLSGVLDATANVGGKFAYQANGVAVTATKVLAAGSYTLSVTFTPTETTHYTTATATVTLVVNQAATTTTITTTSPNPSTSGKAVKVSYTVAPGKPTGHVTVTASTGETCTGSLANGAGYCSITFTTSGVRTLTASYPGDANNEASVSAGFTQTVN